MSEFLSKISLRFQSPKQKSYNKEDDFSEEMFDDQQDNFDLTLIKERNKQNELKRNLMNFLETNDILNGLKDNEKKKVEEWKNKTYPYMGIERFAVPMISTISAGKTSTLNYIINKDKLQIGETITTKFCVIIRDNKNYIKEVKFLMLQ